MALLAEIVGGAAIVISLVVLVLEVRQNTAAVRASTYDQLLSDHTQYRMDLATNTDATEAFLSFNGHAPTGPDELRDQQGRLIWIAGMMLWERAYFAREYGTLGDSEWQRYRSNMCDSDSWTAIQDLEFFVSTEFWDYLLECRGIAQ